MKKLPGGLTRKLFILIIILVGGIEIAVLFLLLSGPLQKPGPTPPAAALPTPTYPSTSTVAQATPTTTQRLTATAAPATTHPPTSPQNTPTPTLAQNFTPALTPSQPAGEPGLTVISPTVAVGEPVPNPISSRLAIYVYRTADPPLLSLQEARTLVLKNGMEWALGGYFQGKRVTLTAVYGLVTLGEPNTGGNKEGWLGPQNFDLPTCDAHGTCVPSGTILPHVEKRPMWILDFGNTDFPAAGVACMTTPCPTEQIFTNSVYSIDAQTKTIFGIDFYTKN